MKHLLLAIVIAGFAHAEDISLVVENQANQEALSQVITLNQGDSAKMIFAAGGQNMRLTFSLASAAFELQVFQNPYSAHPGELVPIMIAGPAIFALKSGSGSTSGAGFATLTITRTGIVSPPAAIPQEAGTTWNVILESSSDLVNWTPINPGEYSGTEPKCFFRTRMVKKL
ncbi:MAG: hypothetical protein WCK77_24305 [Verrucomicrobiota bacterium]